MQLFYWGTQNIETKFQRGGMNASHLLPDLHEFLPEEVLAYKASLQCQETLKYFA